jgi:hypothetical protein
MPRPRVVLNSPGVLELLNDPGVRADLEARMRPVLEQAIATAPVATGDYRASLAIQTLSRQDRPVVQVVARSLKASRVEARTGNLARAFAQVGNS